MEKQWLLTYNQPAERTLDGWEKNSLPIGNGYAGASVFGGADVERVQFTTNEFANTYKQGGVSNFAEIDLIFADGEVEDYERGLRFSDGVAYSKFALGGVKIDRQALFSYPDKIFAYHVQSDKEISFCAKLRIPNLGVRSVEDGGRTGEIFHDGNCVVMRGTLPSRALTYEGRLFAISDGQVCVENEKMHVKGATKTTLLFAMGTSYVLNENVFLDDNHKALGEDPHDKLVALIQRATALGWDALYQRHRDDYAGLMSRVRVDLGGEMESRTTDALLTAYQLGDESRYLEEVYYAYGRHLLVSSSREGSLPSSLQGVWSAHDCSPWGSGFWHNINVQMNYWPAFSTNLAETFSAYVAFWQAYKRQAQRHAQDWIRLRTPENYSDKEGSCGWVIGTAAFAYEIEGGNENQHSGPGTVGLTSKLFWDYYDFTRDEKILKDVAYPVIHGASQFLLKTLRDYDGELLCSFSASPEQILTGDTWIAGHKKQKYYHTVGCAFDQQMLYENACDDVACAKLLGIEDETTLHEKADNARYFPVRIGYSGQIKEFAEENFYGEIGEREHRHISQLVALMPGSTISKATPAWLDAAKVTLEMRGDKSTGWALAHRFCSWARVGDGEHAHTLLRNLLKTRTYPNLWDVHPPFQIDGNFGATAGMTEMLLQSHGGAITLFPALPSAWENVSFDGLKARGNFTVSASYNQDKITSCQIVSVVGGTCTIREECANSLTVVDDSGNAVKTSINGDTISFETSVGKRYYVHGFTTRIKRVVPQNATAKWTETGVELTWQEGVGACAVYRATGDAKDYTFLGETPKNSFVDETYCAKNKTRATYKIVAQKPFSANVCGAIVPVHPATPLEIQRYEYKLKQLNLDKEN